MKTIFLAAALMAAPTLAHAQEAPQQHCCEKMKENGGCKCCKDMAADHDGHEQEGTEAPPADAHQH